MSHHPFGSVPFPGRLGRAVGACKSLFLFALGILALGTGMRAFALTPTATTLAVSSAGSTVTTVPALTVVTLTATVQAGTTPLTVGQVNFCDAAAAHCTDIHLLGMAQITSAGTAVLKFQPGIGSHSYKAVFLGTKTYASSFSGDSALTVTATEKGATTTTIARSGTFESYSLKATVTGVVSSSLLDSPTGTVSFLDTSNGNAFLQSMELGTGSAGLSWISTQPPTSGPGAESVAVGDFNGDGIPDLAVAYYGLRTPSTPIAILLGDGDGTFTAAASPEAGDCPENIAVGDFNGDGRLDLAVTNFCGGNLSILLGNGDGTFSAAESPEAGTSPLAIAVADFNGDGIPDLAVTNYPSGGITILLGKGDGSFTSNSGVSTPREPYAVIVGDFNGDGKEDIVVAAAGANTVASDLTLTLALGNGDGTFMPGTTLPSNGHDFGVAAVADLRGNGKEDLIRGDGTVLLGNGDGTFTLSVPSAQIPEYGNLAVAIGDFNGDGKADVALAGVVLLGNGDGTFMATPCPTPDLISQVPLATADFNGDGLSDLAATSSSTAIVLLTKLTETATATVRGISLPANTGTHYVEASYPGDSNFNSSVSGTTGLITSANLSLSTTSLSFGNEPVGYSTDSQKVVLTNTGGAAFHISSIKLTGANAESFVTSNTCGGNMAAGASCIVGVRFVPGATGGADASITLNSSLSNKPQNIIAVSGTGIDAPTASLSLSWNSITMAAPAGYSSESQNITLTNTGSTVVYFKSITLGGADPSSFVTSNTCGGSIGGNLAPSATCRIGARFVPTGPGPATGNIPYFASITLIDSTAAGSQTISLAGYEYSIGTTSLALFGTSLSFGGEPVGMSTETQIVTVRNTGQTTDVYFKSIALGGPDASSFVTSNTCGIGLGINSCLIGVRFVPKATGPLTATITLTDNTSTSPQTITLTGTGQ